MPRKTKDDKPFTWNGKPVSRTTYFRRKRKVAKSVAKIAGFAKALPEINKDVLAAELAKAVGVPAPAVPIVSDIDDTLLRELMSVVRNPGWVTRDPNDLVGIGPRTFKAITRILTKAGY